MARHALVQKSVLEHEEIAAKLDMIQRQAIEYEVRVAEVDLIEKLAIELAERAVVAGLGPEGNYAVQEVREEQGARGEADGLGSM